MHVFSVTATCLAHRNILDFTTLTTLGKLWQMKSFLCNILNYPHRAIGLLNGTRFLCWVKHNATKRYGDWKHNSTILNLGNRWRWVFSSQASSLYHREREPVTTGYEAGWAPEPIWVLLRRENLLPRRNQTLIPRPCSPLPVAIPTELFRFYIKLAESLFCSLYLNPRRSGEQNGWQHLSK
jgi:hypothetical protein